MTIDNLLSADVVTADGSQVHASETENDDFFWGCVVAVGTSVLSPASSSSSIPSGRTC